MLRYEYIDANGNPVSIQTDIPGLYMLPDDMTPADVTHLSEQQFTDRLEAVEAQNVGYQEVDVRVELNNIKASLNDMAVKADVSARR